MPLLNGLCGSIGKNVNPLIAEALFAKLHDVEPKCTIHHNMGLRTHPIQYCFKGMDFQDKIPSYFDEPEPPTSRFKNRLLNIFDICADNVAVHAGAFCEQDNYGEYLFLWRKSNSLFGQHPLYVADLRESLGQIVFFHDLIQWQKTITNLRLLSFFRESTIFSIPPNRLWFFGYEKDWIIKKYNIINFTETI